MSWNNVIPAYLIGNPYGPIPIDVTTGAKGKYFFLAYDPDKRSPHSRRYGPYDTYEEAEKALHEIESKFSPTRELPEV